MDKSWMSLPKYTPEYIRGIEGFIEFASHNLDARGLMLCPCKVCSNRYFKTPREVRNHLIAKGMFSGYIVWNRHGEERQIISESANINPTTVTENIPQEHSTFICHDDMATLFQDTIAASSNVQPAVQEKNVLGGEVPVEEEHNAETSNMSHFTALLQAANKELYPGCKKYSKLSFILHLYQLKCLNSWTSTSFDMLLELLMDALPEGTELPRNTYEVKKLMKEFDLGYSKIDACPNDCMLFNGDMSEKAECQKCGASRWAETEKPDESHRKKKSAKIIRYFSLIPRLRRMFQTVESAQDMTWHEKERKKDGFLRHPADGEAWKSFDTRYPDFSSDARNVRLGLVSDGFNPFKNLSSTYSIWPIVLVLYNLPPWIGMKQNSFILSTIIPGEKSPGNDIDIYLQPLIDELQQLWQGVPTYDAASKNTFTLRATLLWTINDFPAYAMLSGWSTKGRFACPYCAEETTAIWLRNGKKFAYMGHRRWLPPDHIFRRQKYRFDGTEETRVAPRKLSGTEILSQLDTHTFHMGKGTHAKHKTKGKKTTIDEIDPELTLWKKRSIFFDLPYWQFNLLQHNLDVMHIEKNICDNFINTLLDLDKSKDNLQARLDLADMGIRSQLHAQVQHNGSYKIPPTYFTMTKKEKYTFCEFLKEMKMPSGYASNISRCVNVRESKLMGLKSHDCHVLMQDILPVALLSCGPSKEVVSIIVEISHFLKGICAKVIDPNDLIKLQERISQTLSQLEKYFLPSFFTIMVHLLIHLVDEVRLGGPVHYRWMYPFERFFLTLKNYVGNRSQPEGSIAERYIAEEGINYCARYLDGGDHRVINMNTNGYDKRYMFSSGGTPIGKTTNIMLKDTDVLHAHRYVLRHSDSITSFRNQFVTATEKRKKRQLSEQEIKRLINEEFHTWFRQQVMLSEDPNISTDLKALARGPSKVVKQFQGYFINGLKFHTIARDANKKTQNYGIVHSTEIGGFNYYGRLSDIVELNYSDKFYVVLFKCQWASTSSTGMKKDEYGFTLINFERLIHTGVKKDDDPYIFSSQADQVFYLQDKRNANWYVVIKNKPRDTFDMGNHDEETPDNALTEILDDTLNDASYIRSDHDET